MPFLQSGALPKILMEPMLFNVNVKGALNQFDYILKIVQ